MNKQEFLTCSGLQVQTLDFWLGQRWLIPEQTSAGMNFSDMDVARARLIQDLKTDFGVNDGVDVIPSSHGSARWSASRPRAITRGYSGDFALGSL
jgi:chaperone modulatory protein CbpM